MKVLKSMIIACTLLFFASAAHAIDSSSGEGKVVETMDAAGYTYVLLEGDTRWIAGKEFKVTPGELVRYEKAVEMGEFHSRSLNRTFEEIAFTQKLEVVNPKIRSDHADSNAMAMVGEQLGITKNIETVAPVAGEITPLEGGKTVGVIRTEYQQLKGQEVAIRAKVMKVSKNVLGKNWITLKDGTGVAPENKLLATTSEIVEIGDLVTAKGVINTDVNLGSGYTYKVVLEETTFSR